MAIYNKLKRFWNLFQRSVEVNRSTKEKCGCSFVTPTATRWNSETSRDAYKKREKVCSLLSACNSKNKINYSTKFLFNLFKSLQLDMVLAALEREYKTITSLSAMEWNIIHEYIELMKPIANSLDRL